MIRFTAEQEEFRKAVARFVDAEVVPVADALDERAEFPTVLFKRIGELGYFGLRYPEKYGGAGSDMVTYCLFAEELARGSMSVAAAAAMQSLMGTYFIYKYGGERLHERYLRSEEHTSELQSRSDLVCRLLLEKKKESWRSERA